MIGKLDKPIEEAFATFDEFYNALSPTINQVKWYPRYRGLDELDLAAILDDAALDVYGLGLERQKYDPTRNMSVENWFRKIVNSRVINYWESKRRRVQPISLQTPIGGEEGDEGTILDLIADPASAQILFDVDFSQMADAARDVIKQKGKPEWVTIFDMLLRKATKAEIGKMLGWDSAKVSMNVYKIKEFLLRSPKFRSLFNLKTVEKIYQETLTRREKGRRELEKRKQPEPKELEISEEDIQRVY